MTALAALLVLLSGAGPSPAVALTCPADTQPRGAPPPEGVEQWCERTPADGGTVRHGPLRAWHPNGGIRVEAEICSGVSCGHYAEWHANGKPKMLGQLDAQGRRQGHWMEWGNDGTVRFEADYTDGAVVKRPAPAPQPVPVAPTASPTVQPVTVVQPVGPVVKVPSNSPAAQPYVPVSCPKGALMGGEPYPQGLVQWCQKLDPSGKWIRHGVLREWYPNGQRRSESDYVEGRTTGWVTRWYPNGQKAEETFYRGGVPDGKSTRWNEEGRLLRQEFYVAGKLNSVNRGAARLLPAPP